MPSSLAPSFAGSYAGRKVFVTGHTGFKGSWLSEWLIQLGARVTGYSLPPPTQPALFEQLGLAERLEHQTGDIRDESRLAEAVQRAQPDYIFHLAAQPIVRESYRAPVATYQTNVMGTLHLLEAARTLQRPCAVVCVTTDKCYENREWLYGYREEDPLGGYDPYSSSKAAAEIAIAAWRRSFFSQHPVKVASARAGNVIGGGDWAADRIVPDCIRALQHNQPILVRHPNATRPWQHVLEPLSGYLWLGALLANPSLSRVPAERLCSAFNFGPNHEANRRVAELVEHILRHWPGRWENHSDPKAVHEAGLLQLAIDKAQALLGWAPVWSFATTIEQTVRWYRATQEHAAGAKLLELTRAQLGQYTADARQAGLPWAETSSR
jgi:CDP-glucose 4,6-dehydratase